MKENNSKSELVNEQIEEDDDKTILMDFDLQNNELLKNKLKEKDIFDENQDETDIYDFNENEFSDDTTFTNDDFTYTNINIKKIVPSEKKESNSLIIHNPIKELILKYNLISSDLIYEMEENNKLSLNNLINSYSVDSNKIYKLLSNELGMKVFNNEEELVKIINDKKLDIGTQKNLEILSVVIEKENEKKEYFLISDPFDYELRDYLKNILDKKINFALCKKETIKKSILKYIKDGDVKFSFSLSNDENFQILNKDDIEDFEYRDNIDIPIIPLVNYMILNAFENRASDIHIEPTEEALIIRYRIDGVLKKEINLPTLIHREVISRIKIIAEMNVAEKRLPQDGRFSLKDKNNKNLDVRVSTFPTVYGEKIVMRLLEQDALKPTLEDLNLSYDQLQTFEKKIHSPYGLILISGPTGSGKTTTLYSALSSVDKESLNVLTVENPVEYRLEGTHQMQVNEKIGLTFANGLKTILRQDPDVIMLGEIRDKETANMAIRASLTGHIVFSTIHTNDAIGVIIRLVNMGIDPFLIASSVTLTISQRLVRKICPHCASTQNLEELQNSLLAKGIHKEKINSLGLKLEEMPDFVYGKGCNNCRGTGYLGRQAVFEFFELTPEITQEILKPVINENRIKEICKSNNMKTLTQNSWDLVVEGITTVEEIIRVIGE